MTDKSKQGGARKGAGRKPKDDKKILVTYKLHPDIVRFLRENERPASQLIEEAIRQHFNLIDV